MGDTTRAEDSSILAEMALALELERTTISYTEPGARGNVEVKWRGDWRPYCTGPRGSRGGRDRRGSRGAHLPSSCSIGSSDTDRELSGDLRANIEDNILLKMGRYTQNTKFLSQQGKGADLVYY